MSPDSAIERILELSAEAQIKRREAALGTGQGTWPSVRTQSSPNGTV
jgi:hypothetical protein